MSARNITESTVILIRDYVKTNIAQALADLRSDRTDNRVNIVQPRDYFVYEGADVYRAPAIFVICRGLNFNLQKGGNFINATADMIISAVVEDKDKTNLSYQAWRYQDALHALLNNTEISSTDHNVRLVVKINSIDFSNVYSTKNEDLIWRKEIALQCLVEHWELEN